MVSFRKSAVIQISLLWLAQQGWVAAQQRVPDGVQPRPGQTAPAATEPAKPAQPAEPAKPAKEAPADPSDEGFSIGLFYWYPPTHPRMRNGSEAVSTSNPATLDYPGKNGPAPAAMVSFPAGKYNSLRISYFQTRTGWNSTTTPIAVLLFGSDYNAGDVLSVKYRIQNIKASWDYMSWPFPQEGRTFRVKTLFQAQYTGIHTDINGPQTTDSSGNVSQTTSAGTKYFIYPTLGMGVEKFFTKSFRWEAQASGFYFPGHVSTYDVDTFFAVKRGKLELDFGGKVYFFKTAWHAPAYVEAKMPGVYAGARWYFE